MAGFRPPQPTESAAGLAVELNGAAAGRGWLRHVAALSRHRYGSWLLAAIAFADSSFLPVPPDLLLIPMSLMRPERIFRLTVICIAASSLGAALGYLIGYELWSIIGARLIDLYGYGETFAVYQHLVDRWGMPIIIAKAFTPVPFKIAAIAAGVAAMNPWSFMIATIVGRALHFAMVSALLMIFGARITTLLARYERPVAIASLVLAVGIGVAWYLR